MNRWVPAICAGIIGVGAFAAQAAQLRVTRTELCTVSSTVAVVDVVDVETRWTAAADGGIERVAFVDVAHVVKGAPSKSLEVTMRGGVIDGVRHWVEDEPTLLVNGRYLLFLDEVDGDTRVIGGDQGWIRILPTTNSRGESLQDALRSVEVCR